MGRKSWPSWPLDRERVPSLHPILDAAFAQSFPAKKAIAALARAGCRWVQLRAKELSSRAFYDWAIEAVGAARSAGIAVLVNDRADIALLSAASGVHLGQEDLSPAAARRLLGRRALIGLSTHSVDEARQAEQEPVDYVAIGPVFETRSKASPFPPLGIEGVGRVRQVVKKPLVAIGGITRDNGRAVLEAGADSLAVLSALFAGPDLELTARELLACYDAARKKRK
jgi:thiamine-phosphate pyrophosphorylase